MPHGAIQSCIIACLKDILEKLIVVNGTARFNFKYPPRSHGMSVSIETLQYFALSPKEHGDDNFALGGLSTLNPKSYPLQAWAEP
jgi:hypothetical protein